MRRGAEIGGEAQVEGGDHDKERGPEYLFPSSLEDASKDENASDRAEQTDNEIQQSHDQPADELAARSSPGRQVLQQRRIHPCCSDATAAATAAAARSGFRAPRRQRCKDDRNENERGHIAHQMTALDRITDGLNAHDRRVNQARPHGKPDDVRVSVRISRGDEQKHAQRRIHSDDHHQIVRMSLSPDPTRGPDKTQGKYAKYESQADDDQRYAKKKQTICI